MVDYKNWLISQAKSDHTIATYTGTARAFQQWYQAKVQAEAFNPTQVSTADLQEWKTYLTTAAHEEGAGKKGRPKSSEKRYSPGSISTYLKEIKTFFKFLIETGNTTDNAAVHLSIPAVKKLDDPNVRVLHSKQQKVLLEYFDDPNHSENPWLYTRNKAIILTILYAGLRRNEVTRLDISDLTYKGNEEFLFVAGGNGGSERLIPIPPQLKIALSEWLDQRGVMEHGALFLSQERTRLSGQMVWYLCEKTGGRLGIPHLTPQVLREAYKREILKQTQDQQQSSYLFGNKISNQTVKRWTL